MTSNDRITIDDVARRAGNSRATISRVINTDRRVRPSTRVRVGAAIEELGYVPNEMATALSGGKTRTAGVLLPDISRPRSSSFLEGIDQGVIGQNYQIVLKTTRCVKSDFELFDASRPAR